MEIKKINITLPRGWNQCTREQLEMISDVLREQVERQDRYHPFDMRNVKVALFFALSGIEVVQGVDPSLPVNDRHYICRMRDKKPRHWWNGKKNADDTFTLYLWQINYWLTSQAETNDKTSAEYIAQGKGILDWLDNKNDNYLTNFPYNDVKRSRRWYKPGKTFQGPQPDLDGFSWAQYRFASDMMQNYTTISNNLIKMQQMGKRFTLEQIMQQAESVESAKAMFLATIFNAKTDYIDTNTGITKHDYHYEVDQCSRNADYFRGFPDTQWQVIMFWWTGIMHTLSKRYPHVFKVQPTKKQKKKKHEGPSTPMEIYTATTATMQKYAGLTEDQVNNQSYSLVLEHLERLSKENEELEKIRSKK